MPEEEEGQAGSEGVESAIATATSEEGCFGSPPSHRPLPEDVVSDEMEQMEVEERASAPEEAMEE